MTDRAQIEREKMITASRRTRPTNPTNTRPCSISGHLEFLEGEWHRFTDRGKAVVEFESGVVAVVDLRGKTFRFTDKEAPSE